MNPFTDGHELRYITVATLSANRWFDLDGVRIPATGHARLAKDAPLPDQRDQIDGQTNLFDLTPDVVDVDTGERL